MKYIMCLCVFVNSLFAQMFISEVMYNTDSKKDEWVELYNAADFSINLKSWSISDKKKTVIITQSDFWIEPENYIVLANTVLEHVECISLTLPEFNNSGDEIVIHDSLGVVVDSLYFEDSWGGGRNISLERRWFETSSIEQSNWASCIDERGNTIGEVNSVFISKESQLTTEVSISPNPFSPNGDGFDDTAVITLNVGNHEALVNMRIFDINGRQVRFLANHETCIGARPFLWDGHDDNNKECRTGIYIILWETYDVENNKRKTSSNTVVLAGSF